MFEIHDDIEVLKRMGMACGLEVGKCSVEDLKVARSLVPKALEPYVTGQWPITLYAPSLTRYNFVLALICFRFKSFILQFVAWHLFI